MKKVMIVDDSETMRQLLSQIVAMTGHTSVTACHGDEALEIYEQDGDVDLILTDINMPIKDGITLIGDIRGRNAEIPIITVTTESEAHMREKGRAAGANGWVVKPVRIPEMKDLLTSFLGNVKN